MLFRSEPESEPERRGVEWVPAGLVGAVDAEAVPEPNPGVGPEPVIVLWNGVLRAGVGEESLAVRGCVLI